MTEQPAERPKRRRIVKWLAVLLVTAAVLSQLPLWTAGRQVDQRFVGNWIVQEVAAEPPPIRAGMGRSMSGARPAWGFVFEDDGGGSETSGDGRTPAGAPFAWRVKGDKLFLERKPSVIERVDRTLYRFGTGPGRPDEAAKVYRVTVVSADEIVLHVGTGHGGPLEYHLRRSD
jgi:hypothetical protein